jgi:hypothetical protein
MKMESGKDSVSQVEDKQELNVEDLPVDEKQQDEVKGGTNNLKQMGIGLHNLA